MLIGLCQLPFFGPSHHRTALLTFGAGSKNTIVTTLSTIVAKGSSPCCSSWAFRASPARTCYLYFLTMRTFVPSPFPATQAVTSPPRTLYPRRVLLLESVGLASSRISESPLPYCHCPPCLFFTLQLPDFLYFT